MFRVASYNIRKAIGTDRRRNPGRILDVISEIDADIIALQEADRRFGQKISVLPHDLIREQGFQVASLGSKDKSIGHFGNAILVSSNFTVIKSGNLKIPHLEPRGSVFCDITTPTGKLRIVGMHLDLSGLRRRQQIRSILAQIETLTPKLPIIMMGDCNEWSPHGGSMTEFHGMHIAGTPPSFHSRRPIARLDRIITCDKVTIENSGTHHSLKARYASDHLPVWADVALV
jgi:endonuclease/exonuclease/phosphatase family metal-dependent hydrolase